MAARESGQDNAPLLDRLKGRVRVEALTEELALAKLVMAHAFMLAGGEEPELSGQMTITVALDDDRALDLRPGFYSPRVSSTRPVNATKGNGPLVSSSSA